jgi:hypothetical protein
MASIFRPCYCNRDDVRRALELKQAAYASAQIDRAILSATESVEGLTQRKFYPEDTTKKFDWPNFQYAPPWKVYLDHNELAAQPSSVTTGSLTTLPQTIASGQYICHPINDGPPYNRIELRRDLTVAFGNNPTPQLDIFITGTFGYWTKTSPAGIAGAQQAIDATTLQVSDGSMISPGDIVVAGTERQLVVDEQYIDTSVTFSGLSSASASDRIVSVVDGTAFSVGEVLLVDTEWLLIENIVGNTLAVRRGWDGSLLAEHHAGTIWARRQYTVLRAQLGTAAAIHNNASALSVVAYPGLIRQLAIAEAVVWLTQEHGAYGGASAQTGGREPDAGPGLPDLRRQVECSRYTRHARTRVVLWPRMLS